LHVDPYGNTPREKATLYSHDKLAQWLQDEECEFKSGVK